MIDMIDVQFWNDMTSHLVDSTCLEPTNILCRAKFVIKNSYSDLDTYVVKEGSSWVVVR